ncbi:MAG: GAP family protein [Rubrobacteraceae bacterium]
MLLGSLFGLALLDSINPSALAVTIYLLLSGRPFAGKVLIYLGAVFVSYLALGVLILLGFGSIFGYLESPAAYAVQGVIGASLFGYAVFAPDKPRNKEKAVRRPSSWGFGGIFALGVTVTLVEFSTAFPYFGAIALMTNAGLPMMQWLPILVAYNGIFVLPPLVLLLAYSLCGGRMESFFERLQKRFSDGGRETMLWVMGIVGFLLLADSLAFFEFFGLVDIPGYERGSG